MWYVMQVVSGKEGHTVLMMERILSKEILEKSFIPMRRLKKKYQGKWQEITEKLFPGYVFLISDEPQLLYDELKQIPAFTKLLGSCEEYFTPLSEADVQLLRRLQDTQNRRNAQDAQDTLQNAQNGQNAQNILRNTWNVKNRFQEAWDTQGEKNKSRKTDQRDGLESMGDTGTRWEQDGTGSLEVGLSQVVVGDDRQIRIVSGPLKNLEGQIKKINLHKRIAVVEAEFMGNKSLIHLGIEIVNEKELLH